MKQTAKSLELQCL